MAENPLNTRTARVFLAIPLEEFRQEIESVLEPLRRKVSGVRWSDPRQVHLTLHFFGSVPAKEIESIHLFSKNVAAFFSSFQLSLDRMGGFPSLEKPEIIWLGVKEETGQLSSLYRAIQGEVQTHGFTPETRPFRPHATIGRVKKKNKDLGPLLAKLFFQWSAQPKTADHFVLYQSRCFPEGVRYEVLQTYAFSKKTLS